MCSLPTRPLGRRAATGTNQFSYSERRLFHPRASEVKGTSDKTEGKTADPKCPIKTSLLLDDQQSPPRPVKEEGDVTLNDADIPDSIARALFDALQENRTRTQLPAMRISWDSRRRLVTTAVNGQLRENHQVRSSSLPKFAGKPCVRGYLESTEYCCTCTDKQQKEWSNPCR